MKNIKTKIITIGGGNSEKTLHIDAEIVRLVKKKSPKLLFIPTASSDDLDYMEYIRKQYVDKLNCKMQTLLLHRERYTSKQLEELILKADIIYVGGGNTLMMMRKWRYLGVDKLLKKAWKNGAVMCGLSAGSICWYESGHSDSMHYYNPEKWDYIRVKTLNFLPFIHCPHYDSQTGNRKRKSDLKRMMQKYPNQIALACDDGVAIEYLGDQFRVLSDQKESHAYHIYWKKGKFYEEKLTNRDHFLPLKILKTYDSL